MTARIAHLSDVHFGTEDSAVVEGLVADVNAFAPDVTVVSGDLTQRARTREFEAARAFLDRLPTPQIVVPGNHDIPLHNLVRRALAPRSRFRRWITDEDAPFAVVPGAALLGLDTSRPEVWKNGDIERKDLEAIATHLADLPDDLLKVLVTHHPFIPTPAKPHESVVVGAEKALAAASAAGVDLLLSGHRHTAHQGDVRAHHPLAERGMLVIMAATATSDRRRGEPNGWTTIEGNSAGLTVTDRVWDGMAFGPGEQGHYVQRDGSWERAPA